MKVEEEKHRLELDNEKRRKELEAKIQAEEEECKLKLDRKTNRLCLLCGKPMSFLARIVDGERHKECRTFLK